MNKLPLFSTTKLKTAWRFEDQFREQIENVFFLEHVILINFQPQKLKHLTTRLEMSLESRQNNSSSVDDKR